MTIYSFGGYSAGAFNVTAEGKLQLDPGFDASEDAISYDIVDDDGSFGGDSANDESGDDTSQYGYQYDAYGNLIGEGQTYLEESWTLDDGNGNIVTLYRVESYGGHTGWVADGPITPGVAYSPSGPNEVNGGNAPSYASLHSPTEDPDDANSYQGGAFEDELYTGAAADSVDGGTGDDYISTGSGDDTITGGAGNDTIFFGTGADSVSGGDGNDLIDDEPWTDGGNFNDTIDGGAGDDTIYSGAGDDSVSGGADRDWIDAEYGHDTVRGGSGDDVIYGGEGNDSVAGDEGVDWLQGGGGDDTIDGGAGDDAIFGDWGDDSISGGDGHDWIDAGDGQDTILGGSGDDTIFGGGGNDSIDGEEGADWLSGDGGDDTIDGGADDDTIYGGWGADSLSGGADDDYIGGEDGDDTLDGGDGNDTLDGGSGSNVMTSGTGYDTLTISGYSSNTVTDFNIGDDDSDGAYNDQFDVSELRTLDGGPVRSWDVVVSDDGSGNALLTFPEGESVVMQGVTPAQMSSPAQMQAAGIPCFTAGTMIATPKGEVPVEQLRVGDLVQTRDNGPRPIIWRDQRHLGPLALAAAPGLRPVHIAAGCFGNDRALRLSPQHALAVEVRGAAGAGDVRLLRAAHAARMRGGGIRVAQGVRSVTYVHIMLETHDIVFANGIPAESFYPGPWGLRMLGLRALGGVARVLPGLGRADIVRHYGPQVHPLIRAKGLPGHLADLCAAL